MTLEAAASVRVSPAAAPSRGAADSAHWTSLRFLGIARLIIALMLLGYLPLFEALPGVEALPDPRMYGFVALGYLAAAAFFLLALRGAPRRFGRQVALQIAADVVALSLLIHAAGGVRSGLAILLIAPVAGGAALSSATVSLSFAALATLLLLAQTGWHALHNGAGETAFVQTGLVGALLFATALVVNRLARRLTTQEELARRRGRDLGHQRAINALVIARMSDGVVVLDADGHASAANPAAREMLGDSGEAGGWHALAQALARLRAGGSGAVDFGVAPGTAGGVARRLRARVLVPTAGALRGERDERDERGPPGEADSTPRDAVVVLEDLDRLDERAQQSKLAAMGRLSASIAHEIRNPLGAIRHANGLLAERIAVSPDDPALARLTAIVEANCLRINRIIEDVLSISRRGAATPEPIAMHDYLPAFVAELAQSTADAGRIELVVTSSQPMWFDAGHLRQLLVNLATNALRHASGAPGAVRVEWGGDGGEPELKVADDGPGLSAEAEQHLFEPFFTTVSRGTGLGLFLARELCHANGATIAYRRARDNPRFHGAFVVMPRAAPAPTESEDGDRHQR